jgi:hypothetical protein
MEGMSKASMITTNHRKVCIRPAPESSRSLFIGQFLTDWLSSLGLFTLNIRRVCTFVFNDALSIKRIVERRMVQTNEES